MVLPSHSVGDSGIDRSGVDVLARPEGANDFSGDVAGDLFCRGNCPGFNFGDPGFTLGGLSRDLGVGLVDFHLELRLDLLAGLLGNLGGFSPRVGEGRVVAFFRLGCLTLQILGCSQIIRQRALALGQHRGNTGQGNFRQNEVDGNEGQNQPEDLVVEGPDVQLRHARGFGRAVACNFGFVSHGVPPTGMRGVTVARSPPRDSAPNVRILGACRLRQRTSAAGRRGRRRCPVPRRMRCR
mmetsp:Transcript_1376/g.2766  ORF Transcript_1376/g.2766 Transcript_1376/m.2766 type:complete len:239 (+) Transcript_1376:688-1404(+)